MIANNVSALLEKISKSFLPGFHGPGSTLPVSCLSGDAISNPHWFHNADNQQHWSKVLMWLQHPKKFHLKDQCTFPTKRQAPETLGAVHQIFSQSAGRKHVQHADGTFNPCFFYKLFTLSKCLPIEGPTLLLWFLPVRLLKCSQK